MSTSQEQVISIVHDTTSPKNIELNSVNTKNVATAEPATLDKSGDRQELVANSSAEKNSLEQIVETKDQISQVKASLGSIVDTMAQNPSLFNRAATYYGELPLWQKLVIGLGISVPTLAVGIFAEIGALLVISGVTVVTYTAAGIVLEDHHHCNVNIADRLKKGIISLADVLDLTIRALDSIGKKLAEEVEKFAAENIRLAEHVRELNNQVEMLSTQVELYIETEKMLRKTKEDLEETVATLKDSVTEQSELLQKNQKDLVQVTKDYKQSQLQLSQKVDELKEVRVLMGKEVDKVATLSLTLEKTVATLSKGAIDDEKQKKEFNRQLKSLLSGEESDCFASFETVSTRLNKTEEGLAKGKEEFILANERYNELLKKQEELVTRLVELDKKITKDQAPPPKEKVGELLSVKGFYATKSRPDPIKLEVSSNQEKAAQSALVR